MKNKILTLSLFFGLLSSSLQAQTWNEWFRQKQTQKEYLILQILILQDYIRLGKEGYRIAREGWNTVERITNGEFNLHRDFLSRLDGISPPVSHYHGLASVLEYQQHILGEVKRGRDLLSKMSLKAAQRRAMASYYREVLRQSLHILGQAEHLSKAFYYKMEDARRIQAIDQMEKDMRDLYKQVKDQTSRLKYALQSRRKQSLEPIKSYYDIH
ncbi:hypothetical protein [Echinicola vietnamensis]|uniref:TerB family tellurite resistance protein n=1 Tax=Echinicola vietnamensis (strain DSM 17526 / LMG 23754 / KMM 6221) TaxID=926556 RepID=L0FWB9_ECHVK|nr:hypothetical protein [Echinicola vietnamensis]AGA78199.1 hypothetical protein Echvi_1945 [Echinicola vietnamensis DSM 17526]